MSYYTYILSNKTHKLYVGMTDDLPRRLYEHRNRIHGHAFTARYTYNRLVHFEVFPTWQEAAAREKELKGWKRSRKVALIQIANPRWHDLSLSLGDMLCLK